MPARERLLQLRRRFHGRGEEVRVARAAIERETLADAGAIVERLRSVEALKQVGSVGLLLLLLFSSFMSFFLLFARVTACRHLRTPKVHCVGL